MTEDEWRTSTDPLAMLASLREYGTSERKLKLAACACAGRVAVLLKDQRLAAMVVLAELAADGADTSAERAAILANLQADPVQPHEYAQHNGRAGVAFAAIHPPGNSLFAGAFSWMATAVAWVGFPTAAVDPDDWGSPHDPAWRTCWSEEIAAQVAILLDIFDVPFRPVSFSPSWRTEGVVSLARGIYEERAWDRMGVLGDALEEAGADPELVRHCREPGVHVRGCHVLDAALNLS